jgi:hypothetical protein
MAIRLWDVLSTCEEGRSRIFRGSLFPFIQILSEEFTAMFIIVTVNTQVFPVGSVGGIIQVISVFVVDCQEMPRLFIELPPAFGTDEAMYLEGTFSIITLWRRGFLQFLKRLINGLIVPRLLRRSLMMNSVRSVLHIRNLPSRPRRGEGG